jgi:serine/threonine-protein kinase
MGTLTCWSCGETIETPETFCPSCGHLVTFDRGRYQIVRFMGGGGFGEVYEAVDTTMERRHAVKVLHPDSVGDQEMVKAEWSLLRDHARSLPFIPEIYNVWSDVQQTCLVMEYVDGESLRLLHDCPWPPHEVEDLLRTLLTHLHDLHTRRIIHRDLKPDNIIRRPDGSYVLIDFGIAEKIKTRHLDTRPVVYAVSPHFSPLEQYPEYGGITDARSDLYSLGATAYSLLCATLPPTATERKEGCSLLLPGSVVEGVSPELEQLLMALLELDPRERPASAQEALDMLPPFPVPTTGTTVLQPAATGVTEILHPTATTPLPHPWTPTREGPEEAEAVSVAPPSRPPWWAWVVALLALLLIMTGGGILWMSPVETASSVTARATAQVPTIATAEQMTTTPTVQVPTTATARQMTETPLPSMVPSPIRTSRPISPPPDVDVSGEWAGVIRLERGEETLLELELEQDGLEVFAIRIVEDLTSPYHGIVNGTGTITASTLILEETRVLREYPHSKEACLLWCSLEVTTSSTGNPVLQGSCDSSSEDGSSVNPVCGPVEMVLEKEGHQR